MNSSIHNKLSNREKALKELLEMYRIKYEWCDYTDEKIMSMMKPNEVEMYEKYVFKKDNDYIKQNFKNVIKDIILNTWCTSWTYIQQIFWLSYHQISNVLEELEKEWLIWSITPSWRELFYENLW